MGEAQALGDRTIENQSDSLQHKRKSKRPKAGLILLTLAGFITLYIPLHLYWLAFVPGNFAFTGVLFGGLQLACGVIGWFFPKYVRLLGIFGVLISILSLIGALGGMLVGMLLGMVGGCLCFAWDEKKDSNKGEKDREKLKEKVAV
ncbi:DUF6114 domain-containing protein [Melghirimyces algeriensis]|uniref:Uncharacterized protein n=1 Tax=Melghirimyces algeriensis TaxID=910412 RepID=A0A521DZ32_9BACL|nr:DUF6114 domain-containing protein [Melghirimyces algeriensis]SMO76973.1 hypothetical protein SAMN06264849_10767 [Melghirimyces algeriensis]